MPSSFQAGFSHPSQVGGHAGASGGRQEGAGRQEPRAARQHTPCNESADDGFTSSLTSCGACVYVVATSIKRGQISCVCAAAKLAVVTFPSASLLYNPLLPLKLRARKKSPPSPLLALGLAGHPRHRVPEPPLQPRPEILCLGPWPWVAPQPIKSKTPLCTDVFHHHNWL